MEEIHNIKTLTNMTNMTNMTNVENIQEKKKNTCRTVRFHPSTKPNDGLRENTKLFYEYMMDVYRQSQRVNENTIVSVLARNNKVLDIQQLRHMLADLIKRCEESSSGKTPILYRGGRSGGIIIMEHLPYLTSHTQYLTNVITKIQARITISE